MKRIITFVLILFFLIPAAFAQEANEKETLENLLTEFLDGASSNDAEIHNRFWAEDLIYTSSNGERVAKKEIMDGLRSSDDSIHSDTPKYHAEETQIRLFDDIAVVAFKLVAISDLPGEPERMEFYNTGTFQKRDGHWKAVAWQATRIPED
ncbi:nuclear transport factor 2 family protein [Rhodohalobacter sp. 614A]|uniref:nuclear transport factor 2 family protein n=1 Tax=Rhodohalobacter sp. 614A TaxID=2908649 RepID=UPI001F1CA42E|nr:nuclear transport factor 2 family protein [Rhodohalobacter sp. 614A]